MDFELSEERQMLKDTADRFIREQCTIDKRHEATKSDEGYDKALWAEFCELGLAGALIPADAGGFGGTGEDISLVFEALGRGLVVEPFLPTLLASVPLAGAGRTDLLEQAMEGGTQLAFAHYEPEGYYTAEHVTTRAAGGTLTGRKAVVINGATASHIVVTARAAGDVTDTEGLGCYLVEAGAPGLEIIQHKSIDGPHVAEITLNNTPAEDLGQGWDAIERTLSAGALAVSAEAVGAMEVAKDVTLDYLKERKQFGKPIGANQVLQHRMVDILVELESARSVVMLAANTFEADRHTREKNVSAAKNTIGRAGRLIAEETIQMHGGIAMTWEYIAPHYAKRIVMIDHLFGDTDHHLERFIALSRAEDA
ncbi:MAG: acyl-CoA dehydrogenase family protein [Pseudomonadota bacterium]